MRYVWRAQVASSGAGGRSREGRCRVMDIVGWRPVGLLKEME